MKCGDICLVQFPFTDGTAAKLRPVVVISSDGFNDGEDVVVLPISSSVQVADALSVLIQKSSPHFRQSGLKYPSNVKCTKPLTISKRLLLRKLGVLAPGLLDEVRAILAKLFSLSI
jgi:mRNA interferase MazF